jgi:ankyrin repeat protein
MTKEEQLLEACVSGNLEKVKELDVQGVDLHYQKDKAIKLSLVNGHLQVLKYLSGRGADLEQLDIGMVLDLVEGKTAKKDEMYEAILDGNLEKVKELVENGAVIESQYFYQACGEGQLEIVRYMVQEGFDFLVEDSFGLLQASKLGQLEVVKYLVELGSDIHAVQDRAFRHADQNGHFEVAHYLRNKMVLENLEAV